MRYLSVCSGIEAATVAWHPLGFEPAAFAEIEKAPSAVLAHHYPNVPNVGDFTKIEGTEHGSIDLLVGGTPCQSFSIAGLRGGLSDERGNLALEFIKLAYRSNSRWVLWENVPGVLSSSKGQDFRAFLHGLTGVDLPTPQKGWKNSGIVVGLDGHFSVTWHVLDAQYFGIPQRRRRVFVVGHLGDWRRAASVLLERESLRGNPTPSREQVQDLTGSLNARTCVSVGAQDAFNGHLVASTGDIAHCLNAGGMGRQDYETETLDVQPRFPAYAIQERAICENPDAGPDGVGVRSDNQAYTLEARAVPQAVAYEYYSHDYCHDRINSADGVSPALNVSQTHKVRADSVVRKLTPRECERLQDFPDDYTLVPYGKKSMADGPRYKMLGNSMAVPCMAYIGQRIKEVEAANG